MSRVAYALVLCSLLSSCGKGQLLGPAADPNVQVLVTNHTSQVLPETTFKAFVLWRDQQVTELKGKQLQIHLYFRLDRIMATTEKEQGLINLYVKTTDTTLQWLLALAGEIDRIRGLTQEEIDRQNYQIMVQEFGY
ncbi:hypothetical protein HY496_02765 [Candidatus Woesearchaeota archaeon]|nr:hypothetical protein [Candidatus Woesearchaeota archaeon]